MKTLSLNLYALAICLVLITTSSHAQVENCSQYGNNPTDFTGQRCWMMNYLSSSIFKYNHNQKLDDNYYFTVSPTEIASYFNYQQGLNSFYLDADNMAWGSFWYPCKNGGVANQYRIGQSAHPTTTSLNWNDVGALNSIQLMELSPAQKMDILLGNTDFRMTKWELLHRGPERGTRTDDGFCGFCNGSRLAGALLPEPLHNITVKSQSIPRIDLTFSPSDIKALAAASYMHSRFYMSMGAPDRAGQNDPNPALVDVMLRLYLATHKMPFFLDADPGPDLYNETIVGYNRHILNTAVATNEDIRQHPGVAKIIRIHSVIYLEDELNIDQSNSPTIPTLANKNLALRTASNAATYGYWVHKFEYMYNLYVDNSGTIIDGKWISGRLNVPALTQIDNGRQTVVPAHVYDFQPIDFVWAANGGGDEANSETALNPGNKNINFNTILYLVSASIAPPGQGNAAPEIAPARINQAALNATRVFQSPPTNNNVNQNSTRGN